MGNCRLFFDHIKSFFSIRHHFQNPWVILLLRLGVIKVPYFLYEMTSIRGRYRMLARPTTTSMADLFVLREVLVQEAYQDALGLLDQKNIRLLDIGANLGSFTIWMNRVVGVREAFCFEPEPDSLRLLQFNLALNHVETAKVCPYAVGGESRTIRIALKKDSPGGTNIYAGQNSANPDTEVKEVPVIAFQEWLRGVEGNFDVLKIDCEGAEWEILRKTEKSQWERFRVLVAEVHSDPEGKQEVAEFKGIMERFGYRTVRWDNKPQGLYVGVRDLQASHAK